MRNAPLKPLLLSMLFPLMGMAQTPPDEVFELSPFLVEVETTRGYLATNSVTATGFNIESFKVPLTISVVTDAFIEDLGMTDLSEATSFMAGVQRGAEDRQGVGYFIRGFQTAWFNRNGVRRYQFSGTDNVKQFEVLKGPNAVFYGQTAPGGIVNYVTKRPEFNAEYAVTARLGEGGDARYTAEMQGPVLPGRLAYRIMGSWTDGGGWAAYNRQERTFVYAGLRFRPWNNLEILVEYEKTEDDFNNGNWVPMGNREYMAQYANPPQELKDYVIGTSSAATEANINRFLERRWLDIDAWRADYRQVFGVLPPKNVDFLPEATPYGDRFNHWGPGGLVQLELETRVIEAFYNPLDWLSLRASVIWDERWQPALSTIRYHVRGDGSIQTVPQTNWGLANDTRQIRLEAIFRFKAVAHNNLVLGYGRYDDDYNPLNYQFRSISEIPWYDNWHPFEDPVFDLRDALSSDEVFLRDGQSNVQTSYYANMTSEFLDGRLFTLMGLRLERFENDFVTASGDLFGSAPLYEELTPMIGATYELIPGYSIFASYSQSARPRAGALVSGPGATAEELSDGAPPGIGTGFDIGIKASVRDNFISGTLSLFEVVSKDEKLVTDSDATDADPRNNDLDPNNNVVISRPAGESRSRGIEWEAVITPNSNYQATLQFTWLAEADIIDDPADPSLNGKRVANAPEFSFGFWNRYTFSESMLEGLSIGIGARHTDSYNAQGPTSPNQYDLPAYWAFDGMIRYEKEYQGINYALTLNIVNITDKRYYESPPSRLGDPRTFRLTFRIGF